MALALAALLSFTDPSGDTFGNGSLAAPTASVFRNLDGFDLLGVEVLDTPTLALTLNFAALPNPLGLPNGFSLPIIELYVQDETPGSTTLLPGSGMKLPEGASWHYAFRLTGDRVQAFVADGSAATDLSATQAAAGLAATGLAAAELAATGLTATELGAADGLELTVVDNVITLQTPLPRPERLTLYGVVGAYSPFSDSGWQMLSSVPSPWTFSSTEQTVPVVDVLAEDAGAQAQAVDTQTLPALRRAAPPAAPQENRWLLLVAGGVVVALVGIIGRFTVSKPESRTGLPPDAYDQAEHPQPAPPDSAAEFVPSAALASESRSGLKSAPATLEVEPTKSDPESADLEAWVSSEIPISEVASEAASETSDLAKPDREPIPELPKTYPPGTGPERLKTAARLELKRKDWLEDEDDGDLWTDPTPVGGAGSGN